MAISDYKTNPNENTTISGINIAEGCPPSGINNAIRQLMADVKAGCLTLAGGTMTGTITFNKIGQVIKSLGDDGVLRFDGGSDYNKGAFLSLHGFNHNSGNAGAFQLSCRSSTFSKDLIGRPDGTLTWGGNDVETIVDSYLDGTGENGWIKYADGRLVQWGSARIPTGDTYAIHTFLVPFLSDTYTITLGTISYSEGSTWYDSRVATSVAIYRKNAVNWETFVSIQAVGRWK